LVLCRSLPACCWRRTQLVTYDSVAGCMCFTQRWTILTCSSRQAAIPSHEFEKSMWNVSCIVFRMTEWRVADSARAAIALIQGRLPLKWAAGAVVGYSPKFVRQVISFQHGSQFADRTSHWNEHVVRRITIAARYHLSVRLRPFYRNYINQSSSGCRCCRRRCSKQVSQGRHWRCRYLTQSSPSELSYGSTGSKQDGMWLMC
jgi:hypothetical protein